MTTELELQQTVDLGEAETIFGVDFYTFSIDFAVADIPHPNNDDASAVRSLERLSDALFQAGWDFQATQVRNAARQLSESR